MPSVRELKKQAMLLQKKRDELKEKQQRYKKFRFSYLLDKNEKPTYRRDSVTGSLIYCRHCIEAKICTFETRPKLYVIIMDEFEDKKFLGCYKCKTIQCYDCFALVSVVNNKYLKQNCQQCAYIKLQESKPTKKCECSEECTAIIPVTNRKGKPQKYANGHGLLSYVKTNNIKRKEELQRIANYERKQYSG